VVLGVFLRALENLLGVGGVHRGHLGNKGPCPASETVFFLTSTVWARTVFPWMLFSFWQRSSSRVRMLLSYTSGISAWELLPKYVVSLGDGSINGYCFTVYLWVNQNQWKMTFTPCFLFETQNVNQSSYGFPACIFLIDLFVYKLICRCHISSSITKSKLAFRSAIYQRGNSSPASIITDYFCFCRLRMKEKRLNLSSCASAVSLTG